MSNFKARVKRVSWEPVLERGAEIVRASRLPMALRRLFYVLCEEGLIPNTKSAYSTLSRKSAKAREDGSFPDLYDYTRKIHRLLTFSDPEKASRWFAEEVYRRDRTEMMDVTIVPCTEKRGFAPWLTDRFQERGLPVLELGGYASKDYVDRAKRLVAEYDRPAVLIYSGDFDPEGEDIERDWLRRTACWDKVIRVALTEKQVLEYNLPEWPGKPNSSRAAGFIAKYGRLVQVELEALDTELVLDLYEEAVSEFWDEDAYQQSLALEEKDRGKLL